MSINTSRLATAISLLCLSQLSFAHDSAHVHGIPWWADHRTQDQPDPVVTYQPEDSIPGHPIAPSGEVYLPPTPERVELHKQNHDYTPVVTATLPPIFEPPAMDTLDDFVLHREDLVVVNPAPDEFLWIMEGQRHGYKHLSMVMTNTQTGNGAPLHTHVGEESHVLMKGRMRYVLGDKEFTVEAPYIINIPSMVPHAFINIDEKPVELLGIFPESNRWEYDILAAETFTDYTPDSHPAPPWAGVHGFPHEERDYVKSWYSEHSRLERIQEIMANPRARDDRAD